MSETIDILDLNKPILELYTSKSKFQN